MKLFLTVLLIWVYFNITIPFILALYQNPLVP